LQQICGLCQYFCNSHILCILTRRKIEIVRAHRASVDAKKRYLGKWKIHRVNNPGSESLCVEWSRVYTLAINQLVNMERWRSYRRWIDMTRPLQPPVYRNVTGKTNDIIVLNYLENMFKRYTHVLENAFLREFIALDTIPNILNPKCIIQKMLQKYFASVVRVYREPDFSQTYIFTFRTDVYDREFIFSNCMKFNEDISIICFLHHIDVLANIVPHFYFKTCETVLILTRLMRNKYGIEFDGEFVSNPENQFTIFTIAHSFPSITWDMIHNNCKNPYLSIVFIDFSVLFPDFDLPKTIFIPMIIRILPKLEDLPIAILIAIFIKLHDSCTPTIVPKYPLELIYHQILELYNLSTVPEQLKLKLCTKWNIVIKQNNEYKFSSCFATNRLKAKNLILELRPNDPKLKDILSKI